MEKFIKIITDIKHLLYGYSTVYRTSVQPFKMDEHLSSDLLMGQKYNPEDIFVRESLMEHVGALPIVATYLYQYCQKNVDLGRSLQMLAIHDIGELKTGDIFAFKKNKEVKLETEAALDLLPSNFHGLYMEFQDNKSTDSHFANSIDKILPDFYDLYTDPKITIARYLHYGGVSAERIVNLKIDNKMKHMQWDPFFEYFFLELMNHLKKTLLI